MRLGWALGLAALAGCTSTLDGNLRQGYETIEQGGDSTRTATTLLDVTAEGYLGPDLEYRVGERAVYTDRSADIGGGEIDETETVNQPSVETILTSGPLRWTQSFEIQDTNTEGDPLPDNDRLRTWLLEKVEWAPEEWPTLSARVERRTDEDDLFTDREEINSLVTVQDAVGPFEWLYELETRSSMDENANIDRQAIDHRLRGTWRDELFDERLSTSVSVNLEQGYDDTTYGGPDTGLPPGEVPAVQGLSGLDTLPALSTLDPNPALIDSDENTPAGINIGGFASGGQTFWNMGVDLGFARSIDKVTLTVAEEVPGFLVNQFSFSVWTSADNNIWTLVQGAVPYTYDDVNRRFRLSIPTVTGIYLKVVNELSPPGAPAVEVTEMRVFSTAGATNTSTQDRDDYLRNVLGNFSWRTTDTLTLGWNVLAERSGTEFNDVTQKDEQRLDNTLSALWAPHEKVDLSLRAENQDIQDDVLFDQRVTQLSGVLTYRPLETLDIALSQLWSERDYDPTGTTRNQNTQVRATALLLEDLEAEAGYEWLASEDEGVDIDTDRDVIFASLIARLSPKLDVTLSWRDENAKQSGPNVTLDNLDSDDFELLALWRLSQLVTAETRLTWRNTPEGSGVDQNWRLDWVPLPDGSIDLQFDLLRRVDGIQELTTDQYSAQVKWLINPKANFNASWATQIPEDEARSNLFSFALNLRF